MSTLTDRVNRLVGRYEQAKSHKESAVERLSELEARQAALGTAAEILVAFAVHRRSAASNLLAYAGTEALQQVFGGDLSVIVGDPDGKGARAQSRVLVCDHGHTDEVKAGQGRSARSIVEFALWVQLFHLLRSTRPQMCPVAFVDEPFTNLHPTLMPVVQDVLKGCLDLGIRTVVATNLEEMVPEEADVVELGGG